MKNNKPITKENQQELEKLEKFIEKTWLLDANISIFILISLISPTAQITTIAIYILVVANLVYLLVVFLKKSRSTKLGIRGHMALEKKFITNELPNIIQFVTVLSLFSFYIKDPQIRFVLAFFVAIFLSAYLKSKRQDLLLKQNQDISIEAVKYLHMTISSLIGFSVFIAAEVLSRQ